MRKERRPSHFLRILAALAGVGSGLLALVWVFRRFYPKRKPLLPGVSPFRPAVDGLSEDEAAQRRSNDRQIERQLQEQIAKREIWRGSILSVFNLTMLVMAISQFFLSDPLGALTTLGVLTLNITLNAVQQNFAVRRVRQIAQQAQPFATVIRSGRLSSLSVDEIVIGDVLAIGPGDEILADGIVLESQGLIINDVRNQGEARVEKRNGAQLRAGSICEGGQAVFRIVQIPAVATNASFTYGADLPAKKKTHLEVILLRVLTILLAISAVFYLLLLSQLFRIELIDADHMRLTRDVMGIVFGLAPTGFFLMVIVNYAKGAFDIARQGALIRDTRAIETLAQITTLCIHERSAFSSLDVQIEMIPARADGPALAENYALRALGDLARSVSATHIVLTALRDEFDGQPRPLQQEAFFLSQNGWGAATFTQPDLRGTFVIGFSQILDRYLLKPALEDDPAQTEDGEQSQPAGSFFGRIRKRLKFSPRQPEPDQGAPSILESQTHSDNPEQEADEIGALTDDQQAPPKKLFSRVGATVKGWAKKISPANRKAAPVLAEQRRALDLVFAYLPEPTPLFDSNGIAVCPQELIPVCQLRLMEQSWVDLESILKSLRDQGISIKFFAQHATDGQLAQAAKLGLYDPDDPLALVSADQLDQMDTTQVKQAVKQAHLFDSFSSAAMSRVVRTLRRAGEFVGVLGNSVQDIQSMQQANLAIVNQGSAQALLTRADIVLLKDEKNVLKFTLESGQKIVQGTLDVIKLSMVQIGYVLLLLTIMFLLKENRFAYNGSQGGMVGLFTITLPAIFLTLWARKSPVNEGAMRLYLTRFILPPAVTIAITIFILFWQFILARRGLLYTQHVVTHALVCMGLLLVVFIRPPVKWLAAGDRLTHDRRPVLVAAILFVLWNIFVWLSIVQRYISVAPLASLQDYLIVWAVALLWGLVTQLVWRLPWLNKGVDYLSAWLK